LSHYVYCILNIVGQDLEKQAVEYGSSMDAMQLSLDEIRRQCIDKETKLEQLRTVLEQYEKLDVRSIDICMGSELICFISSTLYRLANTNIT